jgi:DNA polymerase III delta subunit
MGLFLISAPSNAGPGERQRMLDAAAERFSEQGVGRAERVRIDVPGRGAGEEGDGTLRTEVEPLVPLLQSGSLFGDRQGLEIVDVQSLQVAEAEILAELLATADLESIEVVLLVTGATPRAVAKVVQDRGKSVSVGKIWERQASQWLDAEVRDRNLQLDKGAKDALLQKFGTDTAAMGRALDQLHGVSGKFTKQMILDRFKNRPDEPMFHITDAISKGDVGVALRRLSDFLVHGHPLVYLAAVESDLKKRSLAAAAPNEEAFRAWTGSRSTDRGASRVWSQRGKVRESSLRKAQVALVRADRVIKSQPEEVHRVTLERLTVALCRWYA